MPLPPNLESPSYSGAVTRYTGSASNLNDLLFSSIDMSPFQWWSLQLVGSSHVGQLSWQCSMDDFVSTPQAMYAYQIGVPSAYYQNATNVGSNTQIFHGPKFARYFQVIMNAYTSGSVTGILELYANSNYPGTINAIQTGRWAAGTASNGNYNGSQCFPLISAASNNASVIKNSAGMVYGYDICNTNAAVRYVKLYNKNSNPAPAADSALLVRTIGVPPNGRAEFHSTTGLQDYPNGIALATTTGSSTTDNTSVGAGDLIINIDYSPN